MPSISAGATPPISPAAAAVPPYPRLAPSVELLGELPETGFQERQWLVRRAGRLLQLSELLYRVVEQATGRHSLAEIAAAMTASTEWLLTADDVKALLMHKLLPLGLVLPASGLAVLPDAPAAPLLGVNLRAKAIGPRPIEAFARRLQLLYAPPLLLPLLLVIGLTHGWLYAAHGVTRGLYQVLFTPALALAVLVLLLLANVVHEFGHAAALRYGGARAREMGLALYLIYPACYTDTTESYRLSRWARVRTDLGGFYFHLLLASGLVGLAWLLGQEWLLVVVLLIDLDILYQLLPFVRFDGYWALADLTGLPDLFSYMGPFVRSLLPIHGRTGRRVPALKRWVRVAFGFYLVVTVPLLTVLVTLLALHLPQLARTMWASAGLQTRTFALAWQHGDGALTVLALIQVGLLALEAVGALYLGASFGRKGWHTLQLWRQRTRDAGAAATPEAA